MTTDINATNFFRNARTSKRCYSRRLHLLSPRKLTLPSALCNDCLSAIHPRAVAARQVSHLQQQQQQLNERRRYVCVCVPVCLPAYSIVSLQASRPRAWCRAADWRPTVVNRHHSRMRHASRIPVSFSVFLLYDVGIHHTFRRCELVVSSLIWRVWSSHPQGPHQRWKLSVWHLDNR